MQISITVRAEWEGEGADRRLVITERAEVEKAIRLSHEAARRLAAVIHLEYRKDK